MYPYNIRNELKNQPKKEIKSQETEKNTETGKRDDYGPETITMLEMGMRTVSDDAHFYNSLAADIYNLPDKELVLKMYLNKCKAGKILSSINSDITGERLITPEPNQADLSEDICENFCKQMLAELENTNFFRSLLFTLLNIGFRDMLYEIITDMQNNAQILNYLYSKYLSTPNI